MFVINMDAGHFGITHIAEVGFTFIPHAEREVNLVRRLPTATTTGSVGVKIMEVDGGAEEIDSSVALGMSEFINAWIKKIRHMSVPDENNAFKVELLLVGDKFAGSLVNKARQHFAILFIRGQLQEGVPVMGSGYHLTMTRK